uniref:Reticulon-like protein n=1 Tax=Salix viminalis TaxID=40686 RepID=A0A6N2KCE1_SALVM
MPIYSSDSDNETMPRTKLFGRQRPIRSVLGGGQVADVLLWENKGVSAALSIGMTILWFLFEVAEYSFVTLFCHISITAMLVVFIWCTSAEIFNWQYLSLHIIRACGNYFTFLNILYLCFVCLQTLPFLYNKYEDKVERYAGELTREVKKMFRRMNSNVLSKIPEARRRRSKSQMKCCLMPQKDANV